MTPPDLQDDGIPTLTARIDAPQWHPSDMKGPSSSALPAEPEGRPTAAHERTAQAVHAVQAPVMTGGEAAHAPFVAAARTVASAESDRLALGPQEAVLRAALQAAVEHAVENAIDEATLHLKARLEAELPDIVARVLRNTRSG